MKITQINTVQIDGSIVVIGLGEDQKIYQWNPVLRDWVILASDE